MTVRRCICHDRTFEEIKEHAARKGYVDIRGLQSERYCSCKCGLCIPYIKKMLETGETEFEPGACYSRDP